MTAVAQRLCDVPDCDRPVHSGGNYCAGHAKRRERGTPMGEPLREQHLSLRERVQKLAVDLADSDSEDDAAYERAWDALEHAVKDWAKEMHQRRAGKARWLGTTKKERSDFMRAIGALGHAARRGIANLASKSAKGKCRDGSGGST